MVIDDVCGGQVLETLGSEQMMPSTAAQCVAYIACAELPEGSWPEMMTLLTTNVTNPNSTEMLKESSLEAVGYICQDIVCSSIVLFMDTERFTVHIPFCRAMNKCGLRRSLSICPSGSCVLSKQINIFFFKFHHPLATPFCFSYQTLWQYFDEDPRLGQILLFSTDVWLWHWSLLDCMSSIFVTVKHVLCCPSPTIKKHCCATHQWILCMTLSRRYAKDNRTEFNCTLYTLV